MAVLSEKRSSFAKKNKSENASKQFPHVFVNFFFPFSKSRKPDKFTLKTKTTKHLLSYSNLRQTHFKAERDFLETFNFSPSFLTDLPLYLLMIVLLQLFSLSLH